MLEEHFARVAEVNHDDMFFSDSCKCDKRTNYFPNKSLSVFN